MKHAQQTIADLESRLKGLDAESRKIKSAINCLCEVMGEPLKYALEEESEQENKQRPDEYYGRPLATVVTIVLKKNKTAMLLDEIFEQLVAGGCSFTGKNDGIKKRGLAISMSKNKKFHHLPNDTWGLSEWYPNIKESKYGNGIVSNKDEIIDTSEDTEENSSIENE